MATRRKKPKNSTGALTRRPIAQAPLAQFTEADRHHDEKRPMSYRRANITDRMRTNNSMK